MDPSNYVNPSARTPKIYTPNLTHTPISTARFAFTPKSVLKDIDTNTPTPKSRIDGLISNIQKLEIEMGISAKNSELRTIATRIDHKKTLINNDAVKQPSDFQSEYAAFVSDKQNFISKIDNFRKERQNLTEMEKKLLVEEKQLTEKISEIKIKTEEVDKLKVKFAQICEKSSQEVKWKETEKQELLRDLKNRESKLDIARKSTIDQFHEQKSALDAQEALLQDLIMQRTISKRYQQAKMVLEDILSQQKQFDDDSDELSKRCNEVADFQNSLIAEKAEIESTAEIFEKIQNELSTAKKDLAAEKRLAEVMREELESERNVMLDIVEELDRKKVELTERETNIQEVEQTLNNYESLTMGKGLGDRFELVNTADNSNRLADINKALEDSEEDEEMRRFDVPDSPDLPRRADEVKFLS